MINTKTIGVILSGCGVYDGAEIHESTLTLLALAERGINVKIFAPDLQQMHVINHITGQPIEDTRHCLIEAARIARGEVSALAKANPDTLDGIILPGGFGAAKNLCDYATAGTCLKVLPELAHLLLAMHTQKKPLGFICITPIMLPALFGPGVQATLGTKGDDAEAFIQMGGEHIECSVSNTIYDATHKVISTPAYMLAQNIAEANQGIVKLVAQMDELLN